MANNGDDRYLAFKYVWIIENFSYCLPWMKLKSPIFTVDSLKNTKWQLRICFRCDLNPFYITYELCREDDDIATPIDIEFELSFLSKDGIPLAKQKTRGSFGAKDILGFDKFLELEEVTVRKRDFIPNGTLTARCLIWSTETGSFAPGLCKVRSRMGVQRTSFTWNIERFSSLQPGQKRVLQIQTISGQVPSLCMELCMNDDHQIQIQIIYDEVCENNMSDWEISVIDDKDRKSRTKRDKYFFIAKKRAWIFPSFLSKDYLVAEKDLYLPNDVLTLKFNWEIDSGIVSSRIEECKQHLSSSAQSISVSMDSIDYSTKKC
ncbi:MATH domain-containing protein [Trichonephila inaurata madagascariensis]|uniref:MATH domain-containing protein n=1 Tax=Trichonephila inaurata madagascariensis TaxID=2747483 RepID=A0A8X6YLX1_9ARAC|nr:MATH domain-containing protein [Trichonephila inaurata madagascariensis]